MNLRQFVSCGGDFVRAKWVGLTRRLKNLWAWIRNNWQPLGTVLTFLLVLVTGALVIVSSRNTSVVEEKMQAQVDELRKATELEWRPYLHIEWDYDRDFIARRVTSILFAEDTTRMGLNTVPVDTLEPYLSLAMPVTPRITNDGKTPLIIFCILMLGVSEQQWLDEFDQKDEALVRYIRQRPEYQPWDTDYILLADSTRTLKQREVKRVAAVDELLESVAGDSTLVSYVVMYMEYQDFFGHRYNALRVDYTKHKLVQADTCVSLSTEWWYGLKTYRWDVAPGGGR